MWPKKFFGGIFLSILISLTVCCSKKKSKRKKPSQETIETLKKIKRKLEKLSNLLEKKTISPQQLIKTRSGLPPGKKQKEKIYQFLMENDVRKYLGHSESRLKRNLLKFDKQKKIKDKNCNTFIYCLEEECVVKAIKTCENTEVRKIVDIVGPDGKKYFLNGI